MMRTLAFLLAVGLLAAPAAVAAHPGHDHRTMGVVSLVHENHLEVTDAEGKKTTFTLEPTTRIRRGKTVVRPEAIQIGDRVIVVTRETTDKDGKVTVNVREVQLGATTASSTGR